MKKISIKKPSTKATLQRLQQLRSTSCQIILRIVDGALKVHVVS